MSGSLLQRVARCEPKAFDECVDTFGGLVWSLARRYCRHEGDVEDAVQEAFIALWKAAERFDPSRASEVAFVAMVARRRMIDAYRDHRRRVDLHEHVQRAAERHTEPTQPQAAAELTSVQRLLGALSDSQRNVIELCVFAGLSHAEVADRLDLPLGTVKSHARRGLTALRDQLKGEQP